MVLAWGICGVILQMVRVRLMFDSFQRQQNGGYMGYYFPWVARAYLVGMVKYATLPVAVLCDIAHFLRSTTIAFCARFRHSIRR